MNKWIVILTISMFYSCSSNEDGNMAKVQFEVKAPSMSESEKVYIAGSDSLLGNWQPDRVAFDEKNGLWIKTIHLPKGKEFLYKFTRGHWDKEATTKEGYTPGNHQLTVYSDTLVHHEILNWKDQKHRVRGQVTGNVKYHKGITPKGLDKRDVLVWLPPNYDNEPDRRYPVLYMHDGQNVFDPKTSTLERDWEIDELADSLIRHDIIEPIIVVAVYCNPSKRREEYSYEELGDRYQFFMKGQLKPMIDRVYRTKTDREHTAVMGASMGGLISFILAWENPEVYKYAACLSPAFKVVLGREHDFDYVEKALASQDRPKDISLYIDNGTEGLENVLQPGIDDMLKALDEMGYPYTWVLDEGAEHNEMAWAKRADVPLKQFFGK